MTEMTDNVIEVQKDASVDDVVYKTIKDPYGFIYITTNLENGKKYLGQRKFYDGWETYLGSGSVFKNVLNKAKQDGKLNEFHRDIIAVCYSEEELNQTEYDLSLFFDVVESEDWYNLVLGGGTSTGWHPSEETKKKISESAKERLADPKNHPRYGKPGLSGEANPQFGISPKERMDAETYEQWYEKHKPFWENPLTKGKHIWEDKPNPNLGKHLSEEQKEILSIKAKERYKDPKDHPMYGKKLTDDAKEKMRNAHKLRNIEKCITVYSLNFDRIFYGAIEVAKEFNIDPASVTACCRGKQKYCGIDLDTGEKMIWMYAIDAIKNGYLCQEKYDIYVNNIKKEIG